MRQVEELERLATEDSVNFRTGPLSLGEVLWNRQLGAYQQVTNLRYAVSGSTVAGIVGQVRTNLVEIVADLTAGAPLNELPPTARVDEVIRERVGRVGDVHNANITQPNGPTAIGKKATAKSEGLSVADVLAIWAEIQRTLAAAPPSEDRDEAENALIDLREAVECDELDTGEVVKRTGRLRAAVGRMGDAGAIAATSRAPEALTDMAMNGQFF